MTARDDDLPLEWVAEPGEEGEVLIAEFCGCT
jgi:hypothetical protein